MLKKNSNTFFFLLSIYSVPFPHNFSDIQAPESKQVSHSKLNWCFLHFEEREFHLGKQDTTGSLILLHQDGIIHATVCINRILTLDDVQELIFIMCF